MLRPLDQIAIEHDFIKKALSQVLGLLVVIPFMTQVTINGLPVSFEQQVHQGFIFVLF